MPDDTIKKHKFIWMEAKEDGPEERRTKTIEATDEEIELWIWTDKGPKLKEEI